MRTDRHQAQAGFTLLEVIVAFVILALAFGAAFRIFSIGFLGTRLSQDYTAAVLVGQSKLAALGASEPLPEGVSSGRFDERFAWRLSVKPYGEQAGASGTPTVARLLDVQLVVSWSDQPAPRSVTFATLRLVGQ